jgi:hypothetical protein
MDLFGGWHWIADLRVWSLRVQANASKMRPTSGRTVRLAQAGSSSVSRNVRQEE